jgi:3-methyl-2-oxobutanoate hydroxymethyltransferase
MPSHHDHHLQAATNARTSAPEAAAQPAVTAAEPAAADAQPPSAGPAPAAAEPGTASPQATSAGPVAATGRVTTAEPLYGGRGTRRVTVRDIAGAKARGEKWPMLTAYDALTARVFDDAGIPVLLVGDSAAMVVYGYDTTIPVTVDDLIQLTAAVVRGSSRAMVVADLPFGSYQASPEAALAAATRFLKEAGAHAVKLEGGYRVIRQVEDLVAAGIPVMAHLGLTPQSVNAFGGYRVQGRGEDGDRLLHDAKALQAAGAFAVVLEAVPAELAARVTASLSIPTIGIGAGPDCDAQVLVWQDMAGLSPRTAKFVKRYADVGGVLRTAAQSFAADVVSGSFPSKEFSYN